MNVHNRVTIHPPAQCKELLSTPDSYPMGAAHRQVEPIDLNKFGYMENEYQISGKANVYQWPLGQQSPSVRTENAPYCSRMLVRKPIEPENFSGIVVVELLNWASKYDRSIPGWGHCYEYYLSRGIAWIGLTVRDAVFDVLKRFDPVRYSELGFPNPLPPEERGEPAGSYGKNNIENESGLIFDMISQLGTLLKSNTEDNPFKGYRVDKIMATGATGGDLSMYVAAVHPLHCLECQKPVYDGFLIYMTGAPGCINQETPKLTELDDRAKYYSEVPLIHVSTTGDMFGGGFHPDWHFMQRRPDANEPNKKLRLYEIAGCGVRAAYDKQRCVCQEDVERSKTRWRDTVSYEYEFPVRYILKAATHNLIQWMREGIAPPTGANLEATGDYPDTRFVYDEAGNTRGGIRTPYVDAPLYLFNEEGGATRLNYEVIERLYSDRNDYLRRATASTVHALTNRWILPEDAVEMIIEFINEDFPE